jgi:RHS repeat-associated protein
MEIRVVVCVGCYQLSYQSLINTGLTVIHKRPQKDFGKTCTNPYRYGFNGKEKDPEGLGGGGSTYDYGFRIYNPSLGRFLSVDPLFRSYPWFTPYQFAGNRPTIAIDVDGLENEDTQTAIPEPNTPVIHNSATSAGHGGQKKAGGPYDNGAIAKDASGTVIATESEYAQRIEDATACYLTTWGVNNVRTKTTTNYNANVVDPNGLNNDSETKASIVNASHAEIVVEVHINSGTNDSKAFAMYEDGTEMTAGKTTYPAPSAEYIAGSQKLAEDIAGAFKESGILPLQGDGSLSDKELGRSTLGMLFKPNMPSVIVEVGTMQTAESRTLLQNKSDELGMVIAAGMYKNMIYNVKRNPLLLLTEGQQLNNK